MNARRFREEDAVDSAVMVGRAVAVHVAAWAGKGTPPSDDEMRRIVRDGL